MLGTIDTLPVGTKGVDYSFSRPSATAIYAAGFRFVSRYLADPSVNAARPKILTANEVDALAALDLGIMLNWEMSTGDPLRGRDVGQRHGAIAERLADELDAPLGAHIVVSTDVNVNSSQWDVLDEYHHGFASETQRPLGCYVESDYMEHLADLGLASLFWWPAAASWSNNRVSPLTHVKQLVGYVLNNTSDANVLLRETPFWFPSRTAHEDPQEDDLSAETDAINAKLDRLVASLVTPNAAAPDPNGVPMDVQWTGVYTWQVVKDITNQVKDVASQVAALSSKVDAITSGGGSGASKTEVRDAVNEAMRLISLNIGFRTG